MIDVKDIEKLGEGQKVILLMEVAPLTDRFAQIMLTQEEFAAMRRGLWTALPYSEIDPEGRKVTTSSLFDNISIPDIPALYSAEQKENPNL